MPVVMADSRADADRRRAIGAVSSSEVRAALDAVRRIVQALRVAGRDGERRAGVTSAQLFALQQIAEHPGVSINELAALTFTHQSSVSVVIQRLVRRRLVAKVPGVDDRRRQQLVVTAKGRDALRRAPVAVQERLIGAIAALTAADRRALTRSLGQVARLVVPKSAELHPPMFFEDRIRSRPPAAKVGSRSRDGKRR
jgi:DNA-binding MarR family transcriptional regulator